MRPIASRRNIIGMPAGQRTQVHNERLGNAMRVLGWRRLQQRFGQGREWAYVRDRSDHAQPAVRDWVHVNRDKDGKLQIDIVEARPWGR